MDVIEISSGSDSDSDCVLSTQPSPAKHHATPSKARVPNERSKEARNAPDLPSPQKRKLSANRAQDLRIAKQKRHREQKPVQRPRSRPQERSQINTTSDAEPAPAAQPSLTLEIPNVHDCGLVETPQLPFPMALTEASLPAAATVSAVSQRQTSRPPAAARSSTASEPIACDERSPTKTTRAEIPASAGSKREVHGVGVVASSGGHKKKKKKQVSALSGEQQHQEHPVSASSGGQVEMPRQPAAALRETRREAGDSPLTVVMRHWARLWRHPGELYRYWLGRPLFRRARQAGEEM